MPKKRYTKTVDEQYIITPSKGGGILKFEAWEYEGRIVKYSMAYINKTVFPQDNGRVIGYDNSHGFHHKHYLGQIIELDDFVSYHDLVLRFKEEIREFVTW